MCAYIWRCSTRCRIHLAWTGILNMQTTVLVINKEEETGQPSAGGWHPNRKEGLHLYSKACVSLRCRGSFLHKAVSTYKYDGSATVCLSVCHSCAKPAGWSLRWQPKSSRVSWYGWSQWKWRAVHGTCKSLTCMLSIASATRKREERGGRRRPIVCQVHCTRHACTPASTCTRHVQT